jgi:hypothetical protein
MAGKSGGTWRATSTSGFASDSCIFAQAESAEVDFTYASWNPTEPT